MEPTVINPRAQNDIKNEIIIVQARISRIGTDKTTLVMQETIEQEILVKDFEIPGTNDVKLAIHATHANATVETPETPETIEIPQKPDQPVLRQNRNHQDR
jgi:hypothetical protein